MYCSKFEDESKEVLIRISFSPFHQVSVIGDQLSVFSGSLPAAVPAGRLGRQVLDDLMFDERIWFGFLKNRNLIMIVC